MSVWWVNSVWTAFLAPDDGPVIWVDCSESTAIPIFDTTDVLSAPLVETLLPAGLSLWPRGPAWGTPDGEAPSLTSTIAKLTSAILKPFADLYARGWRLTEESRAATLVDSLSDWERDFGLPDPCASPLQDETARRETLLAKVAGMATITPADFVKLAARLGYTVALEEPEAFHCGESEVGIGGELSNTGLEQQFVIHILDAPTWHFEVGVSEVGVDRLLDFDHGALECAIRRVSPAWTYPIFSVEPLPVAYLTIDEDEVLLVDENGEPLLAILPPED